MFRILFFLVIPFVLLAQSDMPTVFMMGEHEDYYNEKLGEQPATFLQVCSDDMNIAYEKWMFFLADIEKSAIAKEYDIRGIKIWINVFFDKDGTIEHVVYHPKPNSKNLDYSEFTAFLSEFAQDYQIDLQSREPFVHFGSASFPTFVSTKK